MRGVPGCVLRFFARFYDRSPELGARQTRLCNLRLRTVCSDQTSALSIHKDPGSTSCSVFGIQCSEYFSRIPNVFRTFFLSKNYSSPHPDCFRLHSEFLYLRLRTVFGPNERTKYSDPGSISNSVFGIQRSEYFSRIPNPFGTSFPKSIRRCISIVFRTLYLERFSFIKINFPTSLITRADFKIFGLFTAIAEYRLQ